MKYKDKVSSAHIGKGKQYRKKGRWERDEKMLFLKGIRIYGIGKWSDISKMIPNR